VPRVALISGEKRIRPRPARRYCGNARYWQHIETTGPKKTP